MGINFSGFIAGFAKGANKERIAQNKRDQEKELQDARIKVKKSEGALDRASAEGIAKRRIASELAKASRKAAETRRKADLEETYNVFKKIDKLGNKRLFSLDANTYAPILRLPAEDQPIAIQQALWESGLMDIYNENIDVYKEVWGQDILGLLKPYRDAKGETSWTSNADSHPWIAKNKAPRITQRDYLTSSSLSVHGMYAEPTDNLKSWVDKFGMTKGGNYYVRYSKGNTPYQYFMNAIDPQDPNKTRTTNLDVLAKSTSDVSRQPRKTSSADANILRKKFVQFELDKDSFKKHTEIVNTATKFLNSTGVFKEIIENLNEFPDPAGWFIRAAQTIKSIGVQAGALANAMLDPDREKGKEEALKIIEIGKKETENAGGYRSEDLWKTLETAVSNAFLKDMTRARAFQIGLAFTKARENEGSSKLTDKDFKFAEQMIKGVDKDQTLGLLQDREFESLKSYHISRLVIAGGGDIDIGVISNYITSLSFEQLQKYSPYFPDRRRTKLPKKAGTPPTPEDEKKQGKLGHFKPPPKPQASGN